MVCVSAIRVDYALVVSLLFLGATGNTPAAEVQLNGHTFTLPDGFEIEAVAAAPLVNRPITADFDERGRLYVADSSGSNDKPAKQLEERTHRIVRLEDTDGDGRFDKSVVFADKMMFPEGTLWYDGSLYVSAPPSIWKLTDTDGDGVADQRVEWFEGKTLTGCANDLHGPYLGLDGWIYWCKGAFAEQTYLQLPKAVRTSSDPKDATVKLEPRTLVSKAAHIFRRKADGTGIVESVMAGGMDNPVDVAFMPTGERIFTTTFLQHPGGGLRDGLIHAIYGGVYGKNHGVINSHPRTGELMPSLVHMGPAAPCGLTCYESAVFGNDYRDNLFACQFNMHKVSRHVLEPEGASYKPTTTDFLVSSNLDFHPTDIQEDADGSLVVCDTGGWYTMCCPTSQLTKPDILGAIYRVRRIGAVRVADARGQKLDWKGPSTAELVSRLADSRPAVVTSAIQLLAKQGVVAIPELTKAVKDSKNPDVRRNAVWTLTRIEHPQARTLVRNAISDPQLTVRLAALNSVSLWRDQDALSSLTTCLGDDSLQIRRVAAEALGRLESELAIPRLLELAAKLPSDRILEHSVTYALIEIGKSLELPTAPALNKPVSPSLQRVVAIANDQMPGGKVDPQQVVPWLTSKEPLLKETALWLVGRHADWGDALAGYLRFRLQSPGLSEDEQLELVRQLAQFAGDASIQQLIASHVAASVPGGTKDSRRIVLEAMRTSALKEMPIGWIEPLTGVLIESDAALVPIAIGTVRAIPIKGATDDLRVALLKIASNHALSEPVRVEALAAIPDGVALPAAEHFQLLADSLREEASVSTRSAAVEAFVKSKLDTTPLAMLVDSIPLVGPLELNRLLSAFEHCTDEGIGMKLIAALKRSPVLTSLRVDAVKLKLAKFPTSVQAAAEELYTAINVEAGRQQEKLNEMMASLSEGDIRRGQLVFNSQKAACSACHAMGYMGGNIGPDLSRIGKIRTERDLLEAVVFPSVSFVRSYEPILVLTQSGKQFNGLIRKESPDEITLATGAKEEVRILRSDIEEIRPSTVSIMPAGLDTQLTKQQIADLIAFLKAKQ
ncbi:PVC-type heme-binding CxxCH protein [Schlesneria paludicola]|uniref:PVC-type heme-binding CxxCH protein n=1 Tax=Schlesneria paludicola TaxID=360056 RepID=UPI00029AD3D0|nr:PVC-type heme-binding CxxCH protein [Schlesneria paludicola]